MDISFPVPDSPDEIPVLSRPALPPLDTDKGLEEVSADLTKFYNENAEDIERLQNVDMGKGEKDADFQIAMDSFVETTKVILDGLTTLANVHPILGAAIFAFHEVISLDLTRRENDRKVLAVKLQMQSMMCSMFQMCKLTHAHVGDDVEKKSQMTQLKALVKNIADEITQCGSDFNYYSSRSTLSKLLKAKLYQRRFADHIETFTRQRSELQSFMGAYTTSSIDAANIALTELKKTSTSMDSKMDSIMTTLGRLESAQDREVIRFIDENGGPQHCVSRDDLLHTLLKKTQQPSTEIGTLREDLGKELREDLNVELKNHLQRFERRLKVQNRNLEQISTQITQATLTLDDLRRTCIMIHEEGKTIRKVVMPTVPIKLKDPELQRIWDDMGLRRSVKAKQFVLTFRDYLITSDRTTRNTPYTSIPYMSIPYMSIAALPVDSRVGHGVNGSALFAEPPQAPPLSALRSSGANDYEEWVLKHIDVAHIQPIIEAMDEDGSGFISVQEANKFAVRRPPGTSLLHWIAYWASGWHYNLTDYRKKIYSIMIQMHRMAPKVLLVNRRVVHMYLDNEFFFRLESILRPIKALPDSVVRDPVLVKIANDIASTQESRLRENLKTMGYLVQSTEDVALIAGSGRLETWLLPLLYLVLERHLEIFKLSQSAVLHMMELRTHSLALEAILDSYDERTARLKDIFQQLYKDMEAQFNNYSYGMFVGSFKWTGIMIPMENRLLLDNDALHLEDDDEEKEKSEEPTLATSNDTTNEPTQGSNSTEKISLAADDPRPTDGTGDTSKGTGDENHDAVEKSKTETQEILKDDVDMYSKESETKDVAKAHSNVVDHSILLKGLGPSLELPEIDVGNHVIPHNEAHGIEGTWVGTYETTTGRFPYPPFQYSITSVADGNLEASGHYFTLKCESEGRFDAKENIIDFKITCGNIPPRRFIGKFDVDRNNFDGRWVTESKDGELPSPYEVEESNENHFCGTFKLTRHTPSAFRFRDLLEASPDQDPPVSIARRRWAFATKAVRFDVQRKLDPWNYFRARIEERNAWVELSMRDSLEYIFDTTRGFRSPEQNAQFYAIMHTLHPSIISVYEAMSLYLFDRYWYNVGFVTCDSCRQRIPFRRYTCITCVKEDYSDYLDFCVEDCCSDSLTEFEGRDFVHNPSHTLLRSTQRLLGYELPFLFFISQRRSERVKRSFRQEVAKIGTDPNPQKAVVNAATETDLAGRPSVTPLICCGCNKNLVLPCWACASCEVDLLFCADCEKTKRLPAKKTKHSHDHHMLRISDSVEAKLVWSNTSNKNMADMETRLNDRINNRLERLETKVLDESESKMAALEGKITGQITSLENQVKVLLQLLQSMASNGSNTSSQ